MNTKEADTEDSRAALLLKDQLAEGRERIFDPQKQMAWRKRNITFFRKGGAETARRDNLPRLSPSLREVGVDEEGVIYLRRWGRSQIGPDAEILGPHQKGRDYSKSPPTTKRPVELEIIEYPKGIETFIRGCSEIGGQYSTIQGEGREVYQIRKVSERLLELERIIANFENLTDDEVKGILSDNLAFLTENGLVRPQNWEKERIRDLLTRGFRDSLGRRNVLVSLMRVYSASVSALRRAEIAIPATSGNFRSIAEVARYKREMARAYFEISIRYLKFVLGDGVFKNFDVGFVEEALWKEEARRVWRMLYPVFAGLERSVGFRPYVLGARKVIEHFGYEKLKSPPDTVSRRVQEMRKEETITDYLKFGRFDQGRSLIEKCISILERVLDANRDWETVKSSKLSSGEKFVLHKQRLAQRLPQ